MCLRSLRKQRYYLQMPTFFELPYDVVHGDDNHDAELMTEILNEVVAVIARSNLSISYNVYLVPLEAEINPYHWTEVYAYDVFALVKCVGSKSMSTELEAQLSKVLQDRNLHSSFGCGTISELSQGKTPANRSKRHRRERV